MAALGDTLSHESRAYLEREEGIAGQEPPAASGGRASTLMHRQGVIVTTRWLLVGAGLMMSLWGAESVGELRIQVAALLGLAVANFFLHTRLLTGRQIDENVVYTTSAADLALVPLLVVTQGGFESSSAP